MNARITFSTRRKLEDYLLELFYDFAKGRKIEDVKNITDDEKFPIIKHTAMLEMNAFDDSLLENEIVESIENWFMNLNYPILPHSDLTKKLLNLESKDYWRALAEIVYYNG